MNAANMNAPPMARISNRSAPRGSAGTRVCPVPEDHRATAVIEDIPREKDHTRPEGIPVAQNGKPQTGAGAHEPARMRAPAALQVGRERGNHEEHRRNIRSGIADAAKKIAVEREQER